MRGKVCREPTERGQEKLRAYWRIETIFYSKRIGTDFGRKNPPGGYAHTLGGGDMKKTNGTRFMPSNPEKRIDPFEKSRSRSAAKEERGI